MDFPLPPGRTSLEKVKPALLKSAAAAMGVEPDTRSRVLVALARCIGGARPEEVARTLTWKEFESFCSDLLMASGMKVKENVVLTRPRAQIDIVAAGPSFVLSIDCKHWTREHPPSLLHRFAFAQKRRSRLLRAKQPGAMPIASAILSFSAAAGSFVDGVAIVPLRTLRSFLGSLEAYQDVLDFA